MKKTTIILFISAILCAEMADCQDKKEQKKVKTEDAFSNPTVLGALYDAVDKSTASHQEVQQLERLIEQRYKEVNNPTVDSTKK